MITRGKKILVVDDEENLRHMMQIILSREGYDVAVAEDGLRALERVQRERIDLVLCDIRMPKMDGLAFLREMPHEEGRPIIIMMSAYGTIETAVSAMKMGAYDYISKPFQPDEVILTIKKAFEHQSLREENRELKRRLSENTASSVEMIGESPPMRRLRTLIRRVAKYDSTILITGESGTGKELVAKEIHARGGRNVHPFVPINCAALPENLLESELFGFRKGAFTDAKADKKGLIEEADGGTLFLDEIGDLPLSVQVKLLRFLQEGRIRKIGDVAEVDVDVRVIAATNQDLERAVAEKRFRKDLYFRLNVIQIHVPPLRERLEDLPLLAEHFIKKYATRHKKTIQGVDPAVFEIFMDYPWKGNIRELENAVERAVLLADGGVIRVSDLPEGLMRQRDRDESGAESPLTLKEARRKMEKEMIQRVLRITGGNKKEAADALGITLRSLQYKVKEYRINI